MTRPLRSRVGLAATVLAAAAILVSPQDRHRASASQNAAAARAWPAITSQTRPWTRWWWLGSAVDKPNLTRQLEDFAKTGLGGVEIDRHMDGERIANAQVRLGTSTVMVSEGSPAFPAMPASYYLYVDSADAAMARAIAAGATKVMDVADMPYNDRQGGVRDPCGNLWWISERLIDGLY